VMGNFLSTKYCLIYFNKSVSSRLIFLSFFFNSTNNFRLMTVRVLSSLGGALQSNVSFLARLKDSRCYEFIITSESVRSVVVVTN